MLVHRALALARAARREPARRSARPADARSERDARRADRASAGRTLSDEQLRAVGLALGGALTVIHRWTVAPARRWSPPRSSGGLPTSGSSTVALAAPDRQGGEPPDPGDRRAARRDQGSLAHRCVLAGGPPRRGRRCTASSATAAAGSRTTRQSPSPSAR